MRLSFLFCRKLTFKSGGMASFPRVIITILVILLLAAVVSVAVLAGT